MSNNTGHFLGYLPSFKVFTPGNTKFNFHNYSLTTKFNVMIQYNVLKTDENGYIKLQFQ